MRLDFPPARDSIGPGRDGMAVRAEAVLDHAVQAAIATAGAWRPAAGLARLWGRQQAVTRA
jgi:hypothetical protein